MLLGGLRAFGANPPYQITTNGAFAMSDTQGAAKAAPQKIDAQKIVQEASWLGARLKEPSTYAGLGVLLTLVFHVSNAGALAMNIQTIGVGLGSIILAVIAIAVPEKGGRAPKLPGPNISSAALLALCVLGASLFALPAHAQGRVAAVRPAPVASSSGTPQFQFPQLPCDPLKLIPFCKSESGTTEGPAAQTADGFSNLLQEIYDKIHSQGQAVIADMQKAQSIAQQKFSDGTEADAPSDKCLAAVIPVTQLIVNNQLVPPGVAPATSGTTTPATGTPAPAPAAPPATPDGPITIFVKTRVIVNALQNPSVQSGCAWLQSSINQAGTSGLANVLAGLVGLTKLGVSIPGVAL
jgi:hypothetical protein